MHDKEAIFDHLAARIIGADDYNFRYYLKECVERLPLEDLRVIAYERNVHILVTAGNAVVGLEQVLYDQGKGDMVLVVFTTNFSKKAPHEVLYIIAHEFAHVFLGHYDRTKWRGGEGEAEADRQVIRWGLERELKASPSAYLR
jgi:Zn-dependent protease with chaperone function